MSLLIGSTGYVGTHLMDQMKFTEFANSKNVFDYLDFKTDLLVCAGLPSAKWNANENPAMDLENMERLWNVVSTIDADEAVLISTIDVYESPIGVNEESIASLLSTQAYGRNRAKFESLFASKFENFRILRLPGLFSESLRKNLVFDLMHHRTDQLAKMNGNSSFQYFDMERLSEVIRVALKENLNFLNIACEPVKASAIANLFGKHLSFLGNEIHYDMRTLYASKFNCEGDYLYSAEQTLISMQRLLHAKLPDL